MSIGPTRAEDNAQAMYVEPAPAHTSIRVKGVRFVAALNSDTDHETSFEEDRWIQGVLLEVKDFSDGDYVELRVMLPSMPPTPDVELLLYAETNYIGPSGRIEVVVPTSAKLPAGLYLKLTYHSVATAGNPPVVYPNFITWK